MRILILAPRAPFPADYGAAQRNLKIIEWLGRLHEVTLLAYGDPNDRAVKSALESAGARVEIVAPAPRAIVDRVRTLALSGEPDLARRLWSTELNERLTSLLHETAFDLIQIEGLEMYLAWATARRTLRLLPRVILDEHNAESILQESGWRSSVRRRSYATAAYSFVQTGRLRRFERQACRSVDGVIDVSPEEDAALQELVPGLRSVVIPNGVDTDHYRLGDNSNGDGSVLFIGKLDYRPNVDAAEWLVTNIWPKVRKAVPEARLNVVGREPLPKITRLADRPGVAVIGPVVDERPWFERAAVLAVPMRMGGGVRLKVLQALATGTTIVSTSFGMSGVGAVDGIHFLRADNPVEFANQVARALGDRALRARLGDAGRTLVCERFDWRVILPRLDIFHREIMGEV